MAQRNSNNSNSIIEIELDKHMKAMEQTLSADLVTFCGPITFGADDRIRDAIEAIDPRKKKLVMLLETTGGYIEVAQRIADTLRKHYSIVEFIVPNYAMSAGTVLVMSGDAIHMDYYSVLGPIDPQVQRPGGDMLIPALGYLVQYERLIEKSKKGQLTTAEMAYLIEKFDPAELFRYEQSRELSITLLREWLVKYKFKNWKKTHTRKLVVTKGMKTRRASEIAKLLSKTEQWHSHGRGISMEVLRKKLKLQIQDFGNNTDLNKRIRLYYKLLEDYMMKRNHTAVVHLRGKYWPLVGR